MTVALTEDQKCGHGGMQQSIYGCSACLTEDYQKLRQALRNIATNKLSSSTRQDSAYREGVSAGLAIAADMARRALEGGQDETSAAPLFPPTEPWPHSLGEQCLQYWGRIERRCQLTQGHEGACYFCVPAYAIRTDIPLDRLSEKATAYDPGPPDCPHGYWKAHCAICLKTIDEPLDPLCNCPVDSWGIVRCQEDSGIVRCRAEVNAENGTTR